MGLRNDKLRWQLASGMLRALHLERLLSRYPPEMVMAIFNLVNSGISIALVAIVALVTQEAFIFPSLGATAFILFHVPLAQPASPRNVLCGHFIGAIMGLVGLYLFGLQDAPSAFLTGVDPARVGAAAVAIGLTGCLMVALNMVHPPAGATALIVALGLMPDPGQLPILMAAVLLLLVHAFVVNRLAGIAYPLWSSRPLNPVPAPE
ncbi:MAG: HPP family protein [Marinobacter sp.]|uniref:HPP family protein n=1 Tax=Marinobacter sp. TaxID=50741 RepID=UPI0034A0559C